MAEPKYTKIKLLVHPLYGVMYDYWITNSISMDEFIRRINITLAEYGRSILEVRNEPNTLFVLVDPYLEHFIAQERELGIPFEHSFELLKLRHDRIIQRFKEFGRRILKDSFVITNYRHPYQPNYLPHEYYEKLAPNVEIESFGAYTENCVTNWATYLKQVLEARGKRVTVKINEQRSRSWEPLENVYNLNAKYLNHNQRRRFRARLTKQKPV